MFVLLLTTQVVFPPIFEHKEDVWAGRGGTATAPPPPGGAVARKMQAAQPNRRAGAPAAGGAGWGAEGGGGDEPGQGEEESANNSRSRFLNWLENTFTAEVYASGGGAGPKEDGGKRTHRKVSGTVPGHACRTAECTADGLRSAVLTQPTRVAPAGDVGRQRGLAGH